MGKPLEKMTDAELDAELAKHRVSAKAPEEMTDAELDAELAKVAAPEPSQSSVSLKGLKEGAIESLPIIGAGIGGIMGNIPGAAIGGFLGTGAKNIAKGIDEKGLDYFTGAPTARGTLAAAQEQLSGGVSGAAQELGGQVIGKTLGAAKRGLLSFGEKGGVLGAGSDLSGAAKTIGVRPTIAMESSSPVVKGLESSLEQSPGLGGMLTRTSTGPARKAVQSTSEALLGDATSQSTFATGEQVKAGITAKLGERLGPIEMVYDDIGAQTSKMPINEKSVAATSKKILGIDVVKLAPDSSWAKTANSYAERLANAQTANDIKTIKTMVGRDFQAAAPGSNDKKVLGEIYQRVSKLQSNSAMKGAIQIAREGTDGGLIGKQLVSDLKSANKQYSSLMRDVQEMSKAARLGKSRSIPEMLAKLEDVPSEKISEKLFNTKDLKLVQSVKAQYPEEFETLRRSKLSDILKKSQDPQSGQVSPQRLVSQLNDLNPEMAEVLFGKEGVLRIDALRKISRATPKMMGPSGSPQGMMYLDLINPLFHAADVGRYAAYKTIPKLSNALSPLSDAAYKAATKGGAMGVRGLLGGDNGK